MSCLLYQSVLDNEEELKEAVEISANAGQSVLEYANVYDGDNKCLIAVVGEIGDKIVQSCDYEKEASGLIPNWLHIPGSKRLGNYG